MTSVVWRQRVTPASGVSAIADERRMTESNLWERSVKQMTTATIQRTKKKKRAANCVFVAATEFCMCVCVRVLCVCVFVPYSNQKIQTLHNVLERFFFSSNNVNVRMRMCLSFTTKNQYFSALDLRKLAGNVKFWRVFFCAKLFTFTFTFTLEMPVCRLPELRSNFSYFFLLFFMSLFILTAGSTHCIYTCSKKIFFAAFT